MGILSSRIGSTWSSAAVVAAVVEAVVAVAVATAVLVADAAVPASAVVDVAEWVEEVVVVEFVGTFAVADSLQGDAESTAEGDAAAAAAFEGGKNDLEAGYGGADEGCHSRLAPGTEGVGAVALDESQVSDGWAGAVAGDAEVVAGAAEQPSLVQPSRLSEQI